MLYTHKHLQRNNYVWFGCHSIFFLCVERKESTESTIQATLIPVLNPAMIFACTDEWMPRKIESSLSRRRRWIDRWYFNLLFFLFRLYLFFYILLLLFLHSFADMAYMHCKWWQVCMVFLRLCCCFYYFFISLFFSWFVHCWIWRLNAFLSLMVYGIKIKWNSY